MMIPYKTLNIYTEREAFPKKNLSFNIIHVTKITYATLSTSKRRCNR